MCPVSGIGELVGVYGKRRILREGVAKIEGTAGVFYSLSTTTKLYILERKHLKY